MGDQTVVDSMMHDGLFCAFDQVAMGAGTEKYAASAGLERAPQDELAAQSHERAAKAQKDGLFDNEIVTVEVPQRTRRPDRGHRGRGRPGRHHGRVARPAAARVRQGRQHHRRQRIADLRRRRRGDRHLEGQGRGARRRAAGRDRRLRPGGRARSVAAHPAGSRRSSRPLDEVGLSRRRPRPVRAERGLRRGRRGVDGRPRHQRRHRPT